MRFPQGTEKISESLAIDNTADQKRLEHHRSSAVAIRLMSRSNSPRCDEAGQIGTGRRHDRIDAAQEMVRWNALFEIKKVEQLALLPTHDPSPLLNASSRRNHDFVGNHEFLFQQHRSH